MNTQEIQHAIASSLASSLTFTHEGKVVVSFPNKYTSTEQPRPETITVRWPDEKYLFDTPEDAVAFLVANDKGRQDILGRQIQLRALATAQNVIKNNQEIAASLKESLGTNAAKAPDAEERKPLMPPLKIDVANTSREIHKLKSLLRDPKIARREEIERELRQVAKRSHKKKAGRK